MAVVSASNIMLLSILRIARSWQAIPFISLKPEVASWLSVVSSKPSSSATFDDVQSHLGVVNDSLGDVADAISAVNTTEHDWLEQFMTASDAFDDALNGMLETAIVSTGPFPGGNGTSAFVTDFLTLANTTLAKARDQVQQAVVQASGKLAEIMPKLNTVADAVVNKYVVAAQKVRELANATVEQDDTTTNNSNKTELAKTVSKGTNKSKDHHAQKSTENGSASNAVAKSAKGSSSDNVTEAVNTSKKATHNESLSKVANKSKDDHPQKSMENRNASNASAGSAKGSSSSNVMDAVNTSKKEKHNESLSKVANKSNDDHPQKSMENRSASNATTHSAKGPSSNNVTDAVNISKKEKQTESLLQLAVRAHSMQGMMTMSLVEKSLSGKGGGNPCKAATLTIIKANSTVVTLSEKINAVNTTLSDSLVAVSDAASSAMAMLNSTLRSAVDEADDIPSSVLSPVTEALEQMMFFVGDLSSDVESKGNDIGKQIDIAAETLAAVYDVTDSMQSGVDEACLKGACGASAQTQCEAVASGM